MIYSHAEFCGIPWETVIKEYRKHNGEQRYNAVHDYVDSFFDFIKNSDIIISNIYDEDRFIYLMQKDFIFGIEENIKNIMERESKERGKCAPDFIENIIRYVFESKFS